MPDKVGAILGGKMGGLPTWVWGVAAAGGFVVVYFMVGKRDDAAPPASRSFEQEQMDGASAGQPSTATPADSMLAPMLLDLLALTSQNAAEQLELLRQISGQMDAIRQGGTGGGGVYAPAPGASGGGIQKGWWVPYASEDFASMTFGEASEGRPGGIAGWDDPAGLGPFTGAGGKTKQGGSGPGFVLD